MDSIIKKLNKLDSILTEIKSYVELASEFINNVDYIINLINSIDKNIVIVKNIHKSFTADKLVSNTFIFVDRYETILSAYNGIIKFISNAHENSEYKSSDVSSTHLTTTFILFDKIHIKYLQLCKAYKIIDVDIYNNLTDILLKHIQSLNKSDVINEYEQIYKLFSSHNNATYLYANLLDKSINYYWKEARDISYVLLSHVEDAKNKVLTTTLSTKVNNNDNPPLLTFNFIPVTRVDNLKNTLEQAMNIEFTHNINEKELKTIASNHKCCFIIYNKIVTNPISYNIRQLTDISIAKNYVQPSTIGVNDKLIEKYEIISRHGEGKWNWNKLIYGDVDCDKFYVLNCLGKNLYRIMAPWYKPTEFVLPKFRVKHLLKNISISRSSNWHNLCQLKAKKNMFLGRYLDVDNLIVESKDVDSNRLKLSISIQIMKTINDIIDKKYKHGKLLIDNNGMSDLLSGIEIKNMFMHTIIDQFVNLRMKQSNFPFEEIMVTYLADLNEMTKRFSKDLHDQFVKDPVPQIVFEKEHITDKVDDINNKIEDYLKITLDNLITEKSNIFQAMFLKNYLLNF